MTPARFELAFPASERPQTHALGRAATGIGATFRTMIIDIYMSKGYFIIV
jgi:hypothetical protein